MRFCEVTDDKSKYMDLLLEADPSAKMISRYLDRGRMFLLLDNELRAECVVTDEGNLVLEIKNLAVVPEFQGQGYGRKMIDCIAEFFCNEFRILQVGTGDSPATLPFYERCGFQKSHVVHSFFTDNYDEPIYDGGVLLRDMVYLRRVLG